MAPNKRKAPKTKSNKYSRNKGDRQTGNIHNGKASIDDDNGDNSTHSKLLLEDTADNLPLSPLTNTVIETWPKCRKINLTTKDNIESIESSVSGNVSGKGITRSDTVSSECNTEENRFDCRLEKSSVITNIIHTQQLLMKKIQSLFDQVLGQSLFSPSENVCVVRLSNEQKSIISQFMQNHFDKIKFLCDED